MPKAGITHILAAFGCECFFPTDTNLSPFRNPMKKRVREMTTIKIYKIGDSRKIIFFNM